MRIENMLDSEYLLVVSLSTLARNGPQTNFTKYNGRTMSIPLDKDETLRFGGRYDGYHGSSSILPVCQPAPQTDTLSSTSTSEGAKFRHPAWKKIMPWSWRKADEGGIDPSRGDPGNKGNIQQMESHLCVDKCWSSTHDTRMITLESVEHMKSDYEYFRQARQVLSKADGGWLQRKLSWRSYTRVTLSKVSMCPQHSISQASS